MNPLYRQATFLTSAARLSQTPPDSGYEVAFAGRSNGPYFDVFTLPTAGESGGIASATIALASFSRAFLAASRTTAPSRCTASA